MPYVIGVDRWQGQGPWEVSVLREGGVQIFIIRLVALDGILFKDYGFDKAWAEAEGCIRWPYIVYSPWSTPFQNFAFLCSVMPADAHHVSIDIELARKGLSPSAYAQAVFEFIALVRQKWTFDIYTAAWCLPLLSIWPACDYWWARYPPDFYPKGRMELTWEQLRSMIDGYLETYGWCPGPVPGPCKLWQISGDRLNMPGMEGQSDVLVWLGTLEEAVAYAGMESTIYPPPVNRIFLPVITGDGENAP